MIGVLFYDNGGEKDGIDYIALDQLTDICIGKRTVVFQQAMAAKASDSCCFSLISKTHSWNLEATSNKQRKYWLLGMKSLLEYYGGQSYTVPSPPKEVQENHSSDFDNESASSDLKELKKGEEDPQARFSIVDKLGEGAYGSVFKARDNRDGQMVAVKVLRHDRKKKTTDVLTREISVLQQCHSSYIVAYKGTFRQKNNIWIVMEYCDSGSLSDIIDYCEITLTEAQIAAAMKMALQGLTYLHSRRKIHRDLKAANILVTTKGDCKLADFGVSAEMKSTMEKRKTPIGTPHWMAPEVINSHQTKYDMKADIWSLGITAYELAVGAPPHAQANQMRAIYLISKSPPPTLPNAQKWSKEFQEFLTLCLQKNPTARADALTLLQCPFIARAGSSQIIADLVKQCALNRMHQKRKNLKTLHTTLRLEDETTPPASFEKEEEVFRD